MREHKWINRDKKNDKRKNGMRIDGKSVILIQEIQKNKADKIKKK